MIYKMYYVTGGGTEYDGGKWEIEEKPKSFIFKCIEQPFYESHCPVNMRISKNKELRHCLRNNEDGSFTVYPFQCGTPHIFEPIL